MKITYTVACLIIALFGTALAKPVIYDLHSIKRFPFVKISTVWNGTPVGKVKALVPNVIVVYGNKENKNVIKIAGQIAYYLGNWTSDNGISPELVRKGRIPSIIKRDTEIGNPSKNLIVVGVNNKIVKSLNLKFKGPSIEVREWNGRKVMVIGGRNTGEVLRAGRFVADRIIGFKATAYKTFVSFVKLRGMLEKGEFTSAMDIIRDPDGLSACGRNMSLASPMIAKFTPDIKKVMKKRNEILYKKLPEAIAAKDGDTAIRLWKEAMFTCYQCHQGIGIKKLRRFVPDPQVHSIHHIAAKRFGLIKMKKGKYDCSACHTGNTKIRGY